jgi:hypothetical protein
VGLAIKRAVKDAEYDDLVFISVKLVHDDVGQPSYCPLERAGDETQRTSMAARNNAMDKIVLP